VLWNGLDESRPRGIVAELATKRRNALGQRFVGDRHPVPHFVEEALLRDERSGFTDEQGKRIEVAGVYLDRNAVAAEPAVGGIVYGFAGAAQPLAPGMGAASVLIVLVCLTIVAALSGGSGVSFGIAAAGFARSNSWRWSVAGGAAGGMIVGAFAELLGLDAFHLLLGRAPGDISGAVEGLALGAAVGLAAWLARNADDTETQRRAILSAAAIGTAAGAAITGLGGRLMAGSLEQLATGFPDSRLRLDRIGLLLGETGFGPVSAFVTGAFEGALFASGIVAAILIARRGLDREP
jgi:hypothetical protein